MEIKRFPRGSRSRSGRDLVARWVGRQNVQPRGNLRRKRATPDTRTSSSNQPRRTFAGIRESERKSQHVPPSSRLANAEIPFSVYVNSPETYFTLG